MKSTLNSDGFNLFNADSLQFIQTLPDNCIDLIATDPPYFRVKTCSWDNQWKSEQDYLAWLDEMIGQFWRVLKPSGSLYMFCSSWLVSDTESLLRQRLKILNHIIWAKPSGPWNLQNKASLRCFFPATERVLFAEHYAGPYKPKNNGYTDKCRELKQNVFRPLIDYFRDARRFLGISSKAINQATGKQMSSHWFSDSQWQLPNQQDYCALQSLFQRLAIEKCQAGGLGRCYQDLKAEHQVLSKSYHELQNEYSSLRRPFVVSSSVPFTDVWHYPSVPYYPGKHPCEKPAAMMDHIVQASSREGDVVADFFMGSGATIKAAIKHRRNFIGVELEAERFQQTQTEILEAHSGPFSFMRFQQDGDRRRS
ncbi:site-specific DNA-methyltransferase [Rouxiella sp. S1S-2]|uniref:DNA-methyltransferase n=1 Tax=Rouxiella sp. S1S-2 TaxID=2653856 RepID=UPI001264CB62|nr:site-specific DNA-methyltransferase [Rouxiella sp. S1S-2]KAB7898820.1 site-specific DNA-methyltransferase [Rouxiella sp. S1S-2]